ncbi:hypothetical protein GA0115251_11762 [Streptomyces sp. TverLS-915]|uniref:hypothetical protein n=1 Tax=Streptomyces sp. TverLS-915 TaxID=1839763 RepID=UPI00081DBE2A|nr:hypothetical protein [Streptomyces sp. TverLS-915]SCD66613.1 hypothetical protein GA0115251_11762 [Streptomyces sp. TverLS-915]
MTAQPARPRRGGAGAAPAADVPPYASSLVKTAFRNVTSLHVSRSAARAAAAVTRTVVAEIIDGAKRAAADEGRTKLVPRDLVSAIDRDVTLEVGSEWYSWTPTFHGLMGTLRDADGTIISPRQYRSSRTPSGVDGAHMFEAGTKKLLRSRGAKAVPAMVRDLDGVASVFLTDLARSAAMVVREGGVKRFGAVTLGPPAGPPPPLSAADRALTTRDGDRRTIGSDDILAATTMCLLPGEVKQRALTEARAAATGVCAAATEPGVSAAESR